MKFEKKIKNVYIRLRNIVEKEYKKKDYEKVLIHIAILADYMYTYNLIYSDKRLDDILANIGNEYKKIKLYNSDEKTVVLYDWFGLDNRGLSLIYAKALNELGYRIVYITANKNRKNYDRIYQEVKVSGGRLYIVEKDNSTTVIKKIFNIISKEMPKYAFLHTTPDDVSGIAAFSALKGIVERYQINLTDHAFWLGTKAFDYCIEFRDMGYAKSLKKRKVEKEKLVILPYYPASNMEIEFGGFPFEIANKRVIYSGGALYKIYGKEEWFNMVSYILEHYDDTIVYYNGVGDASFLLEWIKKKGYENRFFYEPERKDLEQIIRRCYFCLNTYPLGGGLMTQYAIQNGKIPVSLADNKQQIEQLVLKNSKYKFVFDKYQDAIKKIDELLKNKDNVDISQSDIDKLIISKKEFAAELSKIMKYHTSKYTKDIDMNDYIDYKRMSLDRYNNDYKLLMEKISKRDSGLKYKFLDIYMMSLLQK